MEGGMFVSKQIHLDEQACSVHLCIRATFSPWGLRAHLLEPRDAPSIRVVRGGRAGTPSSPYFLFVTRRSGMRFTVRSLGGKLIISAALTLLLCMLLFVAGSWLLLTLYYEHAAIDGANRHLASIKNIYRNQVKLLVEDLKDTANREDIAAALSKPLTPAYQHRLNSILKSTVQSHNLSSTALISKDHYRVLVGSQYPDIVPPATLHLINQALLQGVPVVSYDTFTEDSSGDIEIAVPVKNGAGGMIGVLLAAQD